MSLKLNEISVSLYMKIELSAMKKKRMLLSWLMAGAALCMQAQQTAVKAVADGHYYGAKQQLTRFLEEKAGSARERQEAEALSLVCDYVLDTPGTLDNMGEWLKENPHSPYADVLAVLKRNLHIRNEQVDEALEMFFGAEGQVVEVAYPLTDLGAEMSSYNDVLYRLAGERLYDEGQYQRAVPYLEAGEKTRTSQYKLGMCYYNGGALDKAYAMWVASASAASVPDEMSQNAWLHAGVAALRKGKRTEAQRAFQTAAQMSVIPELREQALYNYALMQHEQSSPGTIAVMEQFLSEFPSSRYAASVSQCLTGVYMTKKDYSKALDAISKVQEPNTAAQADKQKVLYNLAFENLNGNRIQEALTYAGQAVALGNQDAEAYAESYYIKGDCNYRLGNYAQAASDLNTAINLGARTQSGKLKNHAYAVYSLGYAQFKLQKYNAAITQFQKLVALDDANTSMKADASNRMGDCYLNMRSYDEANAQYAIAKQTYYALGDYSMLQQAYIEGLRGNYEKKVELIQQMNAEYPASKLGAQALYEQGRAYVLSGREDEAAAVFGSIAVRYPNSEYAKKASDELTNMATNIAIQDSIAAAQDSIETEAAKAPVVAAQALYDAGQYLEAEQLLNKAIDEGIGRPYWLARAFVLLSDVYKAQDRLVEAKQTLESLKANYKEEDDIKVLIDAKMEGLEN